MLFHLYLPRPRDLACMKELGPECAEGLANPAAGEDFVIVLSRVPLPAAPLWVPWIMPQGDGGVKGARRRGDRETRGRGDEETRSQRE